MKKFTIGLLFCLLSVLAFGQEPVIEWQVSMGGSHFDDASAVIMGNDEGFLIVGVTESNDGDVSGQHGGSDIWAVKLDDFGNIQWQRCFGGSELDVGAAAVQAHGGGYVITGWTISDDGDVSGIHGEGTHEYPPDIWVVKLDDFGNIEWQKCYGGSKYDGSSSIIKTINGYMIAGYACSLDGDVSNNIGSCDYWLLKINKFGNIEWEKSFGGSSSEFIEKIIQTQDGGYMLAGNSHSNDGDVSGNHGDIDMWLVKLDSLGIIEWEKNYGGSNLDHTSDIIQCENEGYVVTGWSSSDDGDLSENHGFWDTWVFKVDKIGNLEWQKSLGGSDHDYGYSVIKSPYGGFIICSETHSNDGDVSNNHGDSDFWLVHLNEAGEIIWQKCFGGTSEDFWPVLQNVDGNYILAGNTLSIDGDMTINQGSADIWFAHLSFPTVGLLEPEIENIIIHPNPVISKLNIEIPKKGAYKISCFDMTGQLAFYKTVINSEAPVEVDLSSLIAGTYLLEVNNSTRTYRKLFLKVNP